MSANTAPIFSRVADIQWNTTPITAANNTADITTGTSYLVFTSDPTNGGYVKELRCKANPANNTAASVLRVWINNGLTTATAANSALVAESAIVATTASAAAANPDTVVPLDMAIPPGYKLYITIGTAPGGSGEFTVTAIGGKY